MTPVIEIHGLTRWFGNVRAVHDLSLNVMPGEIFAFLGLNGAGKSTTIRALLGMIRIDAGSVRLFGSDVFGSGPKPWRRVGHLVESAVAYPELTVRENLDAARRLYGLAHIDATRHMLQLFDLSEYAERRAATLSSGNRQRLALARAFQHNPDLLILDEPVTALDPAGVAEIRELLRRVSSQSGVTVFMSSHLLSEVSQLATRIGVIREGCLIEVVEMDSLRKTLSRVVIEARDPGAAAAALAAAGFAPTWSGSGRLIVSDPRAIEAPDELATLLVKAGAPPTRLAVMEEDLERHFLRLVSGET
jgi:ABC-2 type transport system ATP-binding protein